MRNWLVLMCWAAGVAGSEFTELSSVRFDKFRRSHPVSLILFYEPGCTLCPQIFSILSAVKRKFEVELPELSIATVDLTQNQVLRKSQKISRSPAVRLYLTPEVFVPYVNATTEERFVQFIERHALSKAMAQEVESEDAYKELWEAKVAVYLGVQDLSQRTREAIDAFQRAFLEVPIFYAQKGSSFDHKIRSDVASKAGNLKNKETDKNLVLFRRSFDEGDLAYEVGDPIDWVNLAYMMVTGQYPRVRPLDLEVSDLITKQFIPTVIMFDNSTDTSVVQEFEEVARESQGGVLFAKSDLNMPNARTFAGMFEKNAEKMPILGGFRVREKRLLKFKLTKKPTKESMREFIQGFAADTLSPFFKNGPRKGREKGKIWQINREQHMSLRHEPDSNLVIGYVAKWCSYCHEVKKMFEEALKLIKREKDRFQFAILDLDENDVDDVDQSKIPVIRVWGRSDSEFQTYPGLREAEVFLEWIEGRDGKSYYDRKMPKSVADDVAKAKAAAGETEADQETPDPEAPTEIEKELERISRLSADL